MTLNMHRGERQHLADYFFPSKMRKVQYLDILSKKHHAILVPRWEETSQKSSNFEQKVLLNFALSSPLLALQVRRATQTVEELW